ncbi:MAG: DUF6455 family protein [Hyphomicrobiaceae bacterium]
MSQERSRWPMFRRVERRAKRTHDMIRRLNVDPLRLVRLGQGAAYAEAQERCLHCGSSDKCLRWLTEEPPTDALPDFCPNLRLFLRCRRVIKTGNTTEE